MSQKTLNYLTGAIAAVQADHSNEPMVQHLRNICRGIADKAPVPHLLTLSNCVVAIIKEVDALQAQEN